MISNQIGTLDYGPNYPKYVEVYEGMTSDAGFRVQQSNSGLQDELGVGLSRLTRLVRRHGLPTHPGRIRSGDQLYMYFNKGGSIYYGFDEQGNGLSSNDPASFVGDPTCNDLTDQMRTEFDDDKRKSLASSCRSISASSST